MEEYLCEARSLARYAVGKCAREGRPVGALGLQRMLWFLQSVYCRASGGALAFPDEFEAWPHGPVLVPVYREFSRFGGDGIDACREVATPGFEGGAKDFFDAGIEALRGKSPWELVRTACAPGSPWDEACGDGAGFGRTISNESVVRAAMRPAP